MENEKHFSKIVCTEEGEEARMHMWRDECGIHITMDATSSEAIEALDDALSTKYMTEEEYKYTVNTINEILTGS